MLAGIRSAVIIVLSLALFPMSLDAQGPPEIIRPEGNFVSDFLAEQQELWLAPAKIRRGDVKWLVPLSGGAAALIATDWKFSENVRDAEGVRPVSRVISDIGGTAPLAAAGAFLAVGKLTDNEKAVTTGKLALKALLHSQLIVQGIKMAAQRERPDKVSGEGEFWGGGKSFPSGHSATAWSFATVVAHRYRDKPVVPIAAYGMATAVSLSRIGGLRHFPSDVLIGGAIGYLIGRFVLNNEEERQDPPQAHRNPLSSDRD